ncbi:hypothetical protein J6590_096861 [Homalodisca vitripennis]|nr:hypothetical protein J6590_096861 [Homalodisca vitripennis]
MNRGGVGWEMIVVPEVSRRPCGSSGQEVRKAESRSGANDLCSSRSAAASCRVGSPQSGIAWFGTSVSLLWTSSTLTLTVVWKDDGPTEVRSSGRARGAADFPTFPDREKEKWCTVGRTRQKP